KEGGYESPAALVAAGERDRAIVQKLTALLKKENLDEPDLMKGLEGLFSAQKGSAEKLKEAEARLAQIQSRLAAAGVKEARGAQAVESLAERRKAAEESVQAVAKELKSAGATEAEPVKGAARLAEEKRQADARLHQVGEELKKARIADTDAARGVAELARDRSELEREVEDVAGKLKANRNNLSKAIDGLLEMAQHKDPGGKLQSQQQEINRLTAQLGQSGTAQDVLDAWLMLDLGQKLDVWMRLFETPEGQKLLQSAAKDAQQVAASKDAQPETRAKARLVLGLVLWAQGRYDDSRTVL